MATKTEVEMLEKVNDTESSKTAKDEESSTPPATNFEEEDPVVTPKTWLVVFLLSMGYGLSFWSVPLMAAVGSQISAELGSPDKYIWFIPAWTVSITICFMIAGANTDLLGRRWFLVGGNIICFVGHIVVGTATSPNNVIAGMAITGFGGANCQMAAFALSELLPNKWRHIGVTIADWGTFVAIIIAPVTGRFGVNDHNWRWNFYIAAILQFLSFVGLYLYYFPPAHPLNMPASQVLKELDYGGSILFICGAVPALIGIVWTTVYPSSDPHVIAPLCIGAFFLILFALWERYGNIKHRLTPTYVFTASHGRDLTAPLIALGVVNMFYYCSSIIWPNMVVAFYTKNGTDWKYAALLSSVQGFGNMFGGVLLAVIGSSIKHWHLQLTASVSIMVLFGSLMALGTPDNKGMMIAFIFLSNSGYGYSIYLSIAISQMGVEHKDLGLSGGISGVSRFAAGSIGTAVYTTILANTVNKWEAQLLPAAATMAGLPLDEVPQLLASLSSADLAANYSPAVVEAAFNVVQISYQHGLQMIALASIAFGVVGIVACLCCKDVDAKMNNKIEVYLVNK